MRISKYFIQILYVKRYVAVTCTVPFNSERIITVFRLGIRQRISSSPCLCRNKVCRNAVFKTNVIRPYGNCARRRIITKRCRNSRRTVRNARNNAVFVYGRYGFIGRFPNRLISRRLRRRVQSKRFVIKKRCLRYVQRNPCRNSFRVRPKRVARFTIVERRRGYVCNRIGLGIADELVHAPVVCVTHRINFHAVKALGYPYQNSRIFFISSNVAFRPNHLGNIQDVRRILIDIRNVPRICRFRNDQRTERSSTFRIFLGNVGGKPNTDRIVHTHGRRFFHIDISRCRRFGYVRRCFEPKNSKAYSQ